MRKVLKVLNNTIFLEFVVGMSEPEFIHSGQTDSWVTGSKFDVYMFGGSVITCVNIIDVNLYNTTFGVMPNHHLAIKNLEDICIIRNKLLEIVSNFPEQSLNKTLEF